MERIAPNQRACRNCVHFRPTAVEFVNEVEAAGGSCRRFPPVFMGSNDKEGTDSFGFPAVTEADWCGEFQKG